MLRPFLLIGVGGSGGKTLRVIRDDLQRRMLQAGWNGDLPRAWQFLHIDVPTVADGDDPDLPGQLPDRDYKGLVASGVDYMTIDAALTSSTSKHLVDAVGGWRPDPTKVNIPAAKGAGQYRALGRTITLASLDRVREALQGARRQLTGAEVIGELQRATQVLGGEPTSKVHDPTVIVVSSIAGGSGSGAVIDVCDAVRALGDTWANEIVGLLYAPDVFDHLKAEARRGVRPNSLAALSELLSGYWSEDGPTEGTADLFARYGVLLGSARRLGPRYPFLVGSRNQNVTYQTQNDIYRAIGSSLASWVASPVLQDSLSAYLMAQWPATAAAVPDHLPLHSQGTETPFVALGSSRVGLGRDRFQDYAAEHIARTVVERFLHRHEELRPRGDDRTEKQLVRDVADSAFGGFLAASGLHERGDDHNQIIDALSSPTLSEDLRTEYQTVLSMIKEGIPEKSGQRAADVRRLIRNTVSDRRNQFQTAQLAKRTLAAREWVTSIQRGLTELVATSIASQGGQVALELVRRLATEVRQVREELVSEAATHRRWAVELEQQISSGLDDSDTSVILRTTDRLGEAVKNAIKTLDWEQAAESRELAADLIPDLASNVLEPMIEALGYGVDALLSERIGTRGGQASAIAQWPVERSIPERLKPSANEFLLEPVDHYPTILDQLVQRTIDSNRSVADTRAAADIEVLMGTEQDQLSGQKLLLQDNVWVPRNHLMHESASAAPARAAFRVASQPDDVLQRSRNWLLRGGTAVGRYMDEGLREYLDAGEVGPKQAAERLQRFEGQLIAALNAGAPLVSVNPAILVQVHERREIKYMLSFSEVPLPDKSAARARFQKVLESRDEWRPEISRSFSDTGGASIDIFTVMSEPYEPVVFESLMAPIASDWGAQTTKSQRDEWWRWRRARPLAEALPMSPAVLQSMVRGWFVGGCLGHVDLSEDTGARIFVPADRGAGGELVSFPWPLIVAEEVSSANILPAVLESIPLAMLEVSTRESLAPMRPYQRLLDLGAGSGEQVPKELKQWILDGVNLVGESASAGDWESRRSAVELKLETLLLKFGQYFERMELRTELLGYPGAYELRSQIKSALADLRRGVLELEPAGVDGGWN